MPHREPQGVVQRSALTQLIASAQRRWGIRALRQGVPLPEEASPLPTGHAPLDQLLDGGFPRGALTELLGTPTSGMNTIALTTLARAQAGGELVAYVDVSATFDAAYAAACGVQLTDLLLVRPVSVVEALELIEALLTSGAVGALAVDSLTWLAGTDPGAPVIAAATRRLAALLPHQPGALMVLTALPFPTAIAEHLRSHGSPLSRAASLRLHVARTAWEPGGDPRCRARVTVLKRRGATDGTWIEMPVVFPNDWEE